MAKIKAIGSPVTFEGKTYVLDNGFWHIFDWTAKTGADFISKDPVGPAMQEKLNRNFIPGYQTSKIEGKPQGIGRIKTKAIDAKLISLGWPRKIIEKMPHPAACDLADSNTRYNPHVMDSAKAQAKARPHVGPMTDSAKDHPSFDNYGPATPNDPYNRNAKELRDEKGRIQSIYKIPSPKQKSPPPPPPPPPKMGYQKSQEESIPDFMKNASQGSSGGYHGEDYVHPESDYPAYKRKPKKREPYKFYDPDHPNARLASISQRLRNDPKLSVMGATGQKFDEYLKKKREGWHHWWRPHNLVRGGLRAVGLKSLGNIAGTALARRNEYTGRDLERLDETPPGERELPNRKKRGILSRVFGKKHRESYSEHSGGGHDSAWLKRIEHNTATTNSLLSKLISFYGKNSPAGTAGANIPAWNGKNPQRMRGNPNHVPINPEANPNAPDPGGINPAGNQMPGIFEATGGVIGGALRTILLNPLTIAAIALAIAPEHKDFKADKKDFDEQAAKNGTAATMGHKLWNNLKGDLGFTPDRDSMSDHEKEVYDKQEKDKKNLENAPWYTRRLGIGKEDYLENHTNDSEVNKGLTTSAPKPIGESPKLEPSDTINPDKEKLKDAPSAPRKRKKTGSAAIDRDLENMDKQTTLLKEAAVKAGLISDVNAEGVVSGNLKAGIVTDVTVNGKTVDLRKAGLMSEDDQKKVESMEAFTKSMNSPPRDGPWESDYSPERLLQKGTSPKLQPIGKEDFSQKHEGFRGKTYNDPTGSPTIGYGHMLTDAEKSSGIIKMPDGSDFNHKTDTMTKEQADQLYKKDKGEHSKSGINTLEKQGVDTSKFDPATKFALDDLSFGAGGEIYNKTPKLVAALKSGDKEAIAKELEDTGTSSKGVKLAGLQTRANERAEAVRTGIIPGQSNVGNALEAGQAATADASNQNAGNSTVNNVTTNNVGGGSTQRGEEKMATIRNDEPAYRSITKYF